MKLKRKKIIYIFSLINFHSGCLQKSFFNNLIKFLFSKNIFLDIYNR